MTSMEMENGAERDLLVSGRGPTAPGWRAHSLLRRCQCHGGTFFVAYLVQLASIASFRPHQHENEGLRRRSEQRLRSVLGTHKKFRPLLTKCGRARASIKWLFPDIRSNQLCLEKSLKKDSADHSL